MFSTQGLARDYDKVIVGSLTIGTLYNAFLVDGL